MAKQKDRNLRRLGRRALLEMLLTQTEENETLKADVARLSTELEAAKQQSRTTLVSATMPGTMAEAALKVARVFDAADEAAGIFLSSVEQTAKERAAEYYEMQLKAQTYASKIIDEAHAEAQRIRKSADDYWYQMLRASETRFAAPTAPTYVPDADGNPSPSIPPFSPVTEERK